MKRLGKILSLVVILTVLAAAYGFAADTQGTGKLVLSDTYPKDGATGTAVENMGIKLYFDGDFTQAKLGNTNANAVSLVDEEGNTLPTRVLYSTKEQGVVLVLFDTTKQTDDIKVEQNQTYTFKISGDFVDDNGSTLGSDKSISFKTVNQNMNMAINTAMMFGLFGVMMIVTARNAGKKAQEETQKEEKVNPYKEAKKTGKSVEEIVEKDQKEKAKRAEKAAKKAAALEDEEDDYYYDDGNYHVKKPAPIAAAGGKYITGRKAIAEAKKAQEEKWKAQKAKGKGKGKKK